MRVMPSWKEVDLLSVCDLNPSRPVLSPQAKVDYVEFSGIDDLIGEITSTRERPFIEIARSSSVFRKGDVLFAGITADHWVSALVDVLPHGYGASPQLAVLRPTLDLSARFLWHFFQQPWIRQKAAAMNNSTHSQPVTAHSFFRSLRISLPSLDEQSHIVDCLDQASARPYRQAQRRVVQLKAALSERLMLPAAQAPAPGWDFVSLEDICEIIPFDNAPAEKVIASSQEVDFLSQRQLLRPQSSPLVVRYSDMPNPAREVRTGDMLYGSAPDMTSYGCVYEVPQSSRPTFVARTITVLTPCEGVFRPYLAALLQSRWFNYPCAHHGIAALHEQNSSTRLRRRKLPMPPLERQKHIVAILDAIPEKAIAEALSKSRVIYHTLAQDALRGKFSAPGLTPASAPTGVSTNASDEATNAVQPRPNLPVPFMRARRRGTTDNISLLQRLVWRTVRMRKQVLVVDDPDAFETFCLSSFLILLRDNVSPNQIRRTLEQLAAFGLIQKMNLPPRGKGDLSAYLTAFRGYPERGNGKTHEDTGVYEANALFKDIIAAERGA